MPQLQAAYCIPEVLEALPESASATARALLQSLSHFELDTGRSLPPVQSDEGLAGLIAVALNLTSRGLPTRAPLAVAEAVLRAAWPGEVESYADERRGVGFDLGDAAPEFHALLLRALHVTEPRWSTLPYVEMQRLGYSFDSVAEHTFLTDIVAARLGPGLAQVLQPQAPLGALIRAANDAGELSKQAQSAAAIAAFDQHVDFALPLPYADSDRQQALSRGLVLEVDGPVHHGPAQQIKDKARDKYAYEAGWTTDRLPVEEFGDPDKWLANLFEQAERHPYCRALRLNYEAALHATDDGMRALQLMLSPILAARIHRALLGAVRRGVLRCDKPEWRITVVERDVPGARLGAQAFADQLSNLFALEGRGRTLPELNLSVYTTTEYASASLHRSEDVRPIAEYRPDPSNDFVLDVAMLARRRLLPALDAVLGAECWVIRSSGLRDSKRHIITAPLLEYANVCKPDATDEYLHLPVPETSDALRFFMRDIFRKADFRPGQLPILNRGLKGKSVLGLLPTGGGKSLTYQLAALLQPGVCLVVDPIKSLMQDQFEGLAANYIDAATFINSSVPRFQREERLERLTNSETLFFFLSPERLQIQRFRDRLLKMSKPGAKRVGFSFCVVDEAHCVSEWGHDFRTQYLRLGETARRFCRTYDELEVPIYGLTATASFDVLADVQRELAMVNQNAIIRTRTTRRRELRYRVLSVPAATKHQRLQELLQSVAAELDVWSREATKQGDIEPNQLSAEYAPPPRPLPGTYVPSEFYSANSKGQYDNAGLIFCPHKSARVQSGVESVLSSLQNAEGIRAGKFTAGNQDLDASMAAAQAAEMMSTQGAFVGNKINLLVATKAFGMGIDKPNVRFTIHYCYPGSIESLVQEAGRAGRDRIVALNYILYDPEDANINDSFFNRSFKGRDKEARMVHELLTNVSMPPGRRLEQILNELRDSLPHVSIDSMRVWRKNNKVRLYIDDGVKSPFGFVDLAGWPNLRAHPNRGGTDADSKTNADVLDKAVQIVCGKAKDGGPDFTGDLAQWLEAHAASYTTPGILAILDKTPIAMRHPTLVVSFRNGEANSLALKLNGKVPESLIWEAAAFATDGKSFVESLARSLRKYGNGLVLTELQCEELTSRFEYIRDEQDTYKAIHRLTLLGVVDDYTIDYGSKTITLSLNRHPDDSATYIERLAHYFNRYTTKAKADERAAHSVSRPKGKLLLEKVIGELLDFTYGEIAEKRQRAAKEMATACERGINHPDEDLGEFFDLYFNSKYARAEYLPAHTRDGVYYDRALLWQYFSYLSAPPDGLGKERDNVKHLRGACARMFSTTAASKNGALLLLDGFALLFLEFERDIPAQSILSTAADKVLLGFHYFREQERLDEDGLVQFFDEYVAKVDSFDEEAADFLRSSLSEVISFDTHLRWLREFNGRFDDRPSEVRGSTLAFD